MRERMDEQELERALSDIGDRLAYPRPDVWPAVRSRITERRPAWWSLFLDPRRMALAPVAATIAVLLVVGFLLTPDLAARAAEAIGLPGARIFRVPETPSPAPVRATPTFAGQRASSLAEASALAGFAVRAPTALGEPDAIYVETAPARVTLVYATRAGIPASPVAGLSAIVVEFRGRIDVNVVGKTVGPETRIDSVPVSGGVGYWLEGQPHQFFYVDPSGNFQQETLRLAGNTLLWEAAGVTYRLEAQVSKEEAVRIASTLR